MQSYFQKTTSAAPLAVFRIALGLLLFVSMVRFWLNGWIEELYIRPQFFFTFYGFDFVKPWGEYTYLLFFICALSALMVAFGFFYRLAATLLFLSFTYIELIDKSTYLNHYYFISLICLLMIFLPAHAFFSADAWRNKYLNASKVPQWTIDSIKFFVCILYFYAGLAKINSDWLLEAMPLKIWLPAKNDIPLIGSLFNYKLTAYAFSWIGCMYDLSIPFLLLYSQTRLFAYLAVVIFHVLTSILFPIGMFPYIMMATALIFFSGSFHLKIIEKLSEWLRISKDFISNQKTYSFKPVWSRILIGSLIFFFVFQILFPFRYVFYPGELFWTEEGYRFSWRVMLMEKAGYAQFTVKDQTGKIAMVDNSQFLTKLQEKMMATQPDMILQYAHLLKTHYEKQGFENPEVYVESYVTLNGRLSKLLIDPKVNLAAQHDSFAHKPWILPFEDDVANRLNR